MAFKLKRTEKLFQALQAAHAEYLNTSDGNEKLVPDAFTRFIIWNIPAIKTCPFRTALCEKYCYAVKAENLYPDCLPSRERNFEISRRADFVDNMTYTILKIRRGSRKKNVVVRIHESGDFYNKEYAGKWLAIMENCKGENIKFIAYTKSFPYFDGVKLPKNFSLRASIWADTKEEHRETIRRNDWNIYTAVEKFETGDAFTRCRCKDCASCAKCWSNYKDIRCEIH